MKAILMLVLVSVYANVMAEEIYKSVDKDGNVTYSSTPPANAVQTENVALPPGPTQEQVRAAEQQQQQLEQSNAQQEQARKTREAEQAAQKAAQQPSMEVQTLPAQMPPPDGDYPVAVPYDRGRVYPRPATRPIR